MKERLKQIAVYVLDETHEAVKLRAKELKAKSMNNYINQLIKIDLDNGKK